MDEFYTQAAAIIAELGGESMSYWDVYIIFGIIFLITSIAFFIVSQPLKNLFEAELIQHRVLAATQKSPGLIQKIAALFGKK